MADSDKKEGTVSTGARQKTGIRGRRKGSLNRRSTSSRRSSTSSEASRSSTRQNGSRYRTLTKTCNLCNEVCIQNGRDWNSVECVICKTWQHPKCTQVDIKVLEEIWMRKNFMCNVCKEKMENDDSGTSEMDTEGDQSGNNGQNGKSQIEGVEIQFMTPSLPEGNVHQNVDKEFEGKIQAEGGEENSSLPKSSTPIKENTNPSVPPSVSVNTEKSAKIEPMNPVEKKIDEVMAMIVDLKKDVKKNDVKVKLIDAQQDNYLRTTTFKLKEGVYKAVDEAFGNIENKVTNKIQVDMDKKLEKKVTEKAEQLEKRLELTINKVVDKKLDHQSIKNLEKKMDDRIEQSLNKKIDQKVDDRINKVMDQKVDEKINRKFDRTMDNKLESAFDTFQERLWRRKNVIIVNLPESNRLNIEDRKYDDLDEVHRLFNKIMNFDINEIDGLPARVGRISRDHPRLLRVTLRSERMVRDLVYRAKDKIDIMNPYENDKKKKIYINKV